MRLTQSLHFGIVICLTIARPVCGQSFPADETARKTPIAAGTLPAQQPKLSPGAEEIARTIGVAPLIERFYNLPERDRGMVDGVMSLEALSLRQQITESIFGAALLVDGLITEIESELTQIGVVRSQLEGRRNRPLATSDFAIIIAGAMSGVIGRGLQFSDSASNAGSVIGIVGGATSTVLAFISLRQRRGGKLPLGVAPNMLAKLFDRRPEFHSDYPEEIWTYLNAVPPTEPGQVTRREQLIKHWTETGRIELGATARAKHKIELLTSGVSNQPPLTIDLLNDRAAMLADVRVQVALMKYDLSWLILALRSR